ncbi:hypothetical protein HAX54_047419 [Datura stramonium]|uniref:Pistil-specific extensin-like protein n=1 Tax=Datura stramonium TaxID=4076 RepID=A0ABS8STU8_DATST|nr:hypothetical protein [Datura stramonium]
MAFTSVKAIVLIQLLALVLGSFSKLSFGEVPESWSLDDQHDNKIISIPSPSSSPSIKSPPAQSPKQPSPPSPTAQPPANPRVPPPSLPPPPATQLPIRTPPPPSAPIQLPITKSPPPSPAIQLPIRTSPPPPAPIQLPITKSPPPSPVTQLPIRTPPPPSAPIQLPITKSPPSPATQLPITKSPPPSPATQLPIRTPPPPSALRKPPPPSPPTNQKPINSSPPPPTYYYEPPTVEPPTDHEPPPIDHQPPIIIPFPPIVGPPSIPRITPPVKLPPPSILPAGKPLIVVGRVNCRSCNSRGLLSLFKASPLEGASVKLVCHNNGRKTNVQSALTDRNGDFAIVPIYLTRADVHKCKVYLVKSPKPICSVPTNFNNGKSGALLKPVLPPRPPGNPGPVQPPMFDFIGVGPFIFEAPSKFPCKK